MIVKQKKKNFVRACYANFNQNIAGGVLAMLPIVFFLLWNFTQIFPLCCVFSKEFLLRHSQITPKIPKKTTYWRHGWAYEILQEFSADITLNDSRNFARSWYTNLNIFFYFQHVFSLKNNLCFRLTSTSSQMFSSFIYLFIFLETFPGACCKIHSNNIRNFPN